MIARYRPPAPLAALLAGALLASPACYDLKKANPGPRWIDDFSKYPDPTWNVFQPWVCGKLIIPTPRDGGARDGGPGDGGPGDGGSADAGTRADTADGGSPETPCPAGPGDDVTYPGPPPDTQGLETTFDLPGGTTDIGVYAESRLVAGAQPIDVTGFKQLVVSARLESASPKQNPLPPGTELRAELGCSRNQIDPTARQLIPIQVDNPWVQFRLTLAMFDVTGTSLSQACLAEVDSIRFVVRPGNNEAAAVTGTLSIDDVQLQN
jgi:hypothetical protein